MSPCPAASVPRDGASSKVIKLDSVRLIAEKVRDLPCVLGAVWTGAWGARGRHPQGG